MWKLNTARGKEHLLMKEAKKVKSEKRRMGLPHIPYEITLVGVP